MNSPISDKTVFSIQPGAFNRVKSVFGLRHALVNAANNKCLNRVGRSAKRRCFVEIPDFFHPICMRTNSSDTDVIKEVFKYREHACMDDIKDPHIIIDCGANVGYASLYYLNKFPAAKVIALEPDQSNFKIAKVNLIPYKERSVLLGYAVWNSTTGLVLSPKVYGDKREWATQVRAPVAGEKTDVKAVDLYSLIKKYRIESIDILKIDVERAEEALFSSNYEPWLDRVKNIIIEIHDERCERVFLNAMTGYDYQLIKTTYSTVCKNITKKVAQTRKTI